MKDVLDVDKVVDLNWVKTVCITPPVPLVGTPVVGIILSTLNSDAIIYEGSVGQVTDVKSKLKLESNLGVALAGKSRSA